MKELKLIPIEVSARHIHLSESDFYTLCGKDAKMNFVKALSQPGQFQSDIKLDIVGPKRSLFGVSVLGPFRKQTQVEISLTDARSVGVKAPIRESGDLKDSGPIIIKGPYGEISLPEGTIVAMRHVHMTPVDAQYYGVTNGQVVAIEIDSEGRKTLYGDVVCRVSDTYALAMHIDTDEGNAANFSSTIGGILIK